MEQGKDVTITGIDHINIGTTRLAETVAFFRDVLGLSVGARPNFPFPGAWLYSGETAVVHLVELGHSKGPSSESALDHFAFRISDYDDIVARLTAADMEFTAFDVPGTTTRQIFVRDMNGVSIELNYRPA